MAVTPAGTARTQHSSRPARSFFRVAAAALLALAVVAPGLEIHSTAAAHDEVSTLGGRPDVYFPAASHPAHRPHAEAAQAAQRPLCAACLNRLQGSGAHLAETARPATPLGDRALPPSSPAPPLERCSRSDGARAPPRA